MREGFLEEVRPGQNVSGWGRINQEEGRGGELGSLGRSESMSDSRGLGSPPCALELQEGRCYSAQIAGGKAESVVGELSTGCVMGPCKLCSGVDMFPPVGNREPLKEHDLGRSMV